MINQRDRLGTEPGIGPVDDVAPSSPESSALSPVVYQEPTPVPAASEHAQSDLPSVQLAREIDIDPRRLPTELKLRPVISSLTPPPSDPIGEEPVFELRPGQRSDSGWPPPETVVTTSQRPGPLSAPRSARAQFALAVSLGALLLLVLARAAMHRFQAATATSTHVVAAPLVSAPVLAPARSTVRVLRPTPRPVAPALAAPLTVTTAPPRIATPQATHVAIAPHLAPARAAPVALPSSAVEAAPSAAKPKRAIY